MISTAFLMPTNASMEVYYPPYCFYRIFNDAIGNGFCHQFFIERDNTGFLTGYTEMEFYTSNTPPFSGTKYINLSFYVKNTDGTSGYVVNSFITAIQPNDDIYYSQVDYTPYIFSSSQTVSRVESRANVAGSAASSYILPGNSLSPVTGLAYISELSKTRSQILSHGLDYMNDN